VHAARLTFSILERIDVGETDYTRLPRTPASTFSILERIDVGETTLSFIASIPLVGLSVSSNGSTWVKPRGQRRRRLLLLSFSILERIDVGETFWKPSARSICSRSFSILERIDVGETKRRQRAFRISISFQYPRTDRRG